MCIKKYFKKNRKNSKELELIYKSNSGIPFKWEYEIEDESIVEFVKSFVSKNYGNGITSGSPIDISYVFKGVRKGETMIKFKFVNFTDGRVSESKVNHVVVDENLNISLKLK